MGFSKINPKDLIFSLDIGTRSIIGTVGVVKEKKFNVICESYMEHSERSMIDGQIHNIQSVAEVVVKVKQDLEKKLGVKLTDVNIAAAGRFLRTAVTKVDMEIDIEKEIDKDTVSALELTAVKKAEEEVDRQSQGKLYCVGYSVKNYYLNGYLIGSLLSHKGENISAEVIATFLPRSVVDSLYSVMNKAGLKVKNLTLEPIAAMEAAVPQNLRLLNIALIDIGAGTSDIAISSKDSIVAYGMVPLAGDEITEIIAQTYLTDFNTAEEIKRACLKEENISFVDVLGMENQISSEEVLKVINPSVVKISEQIADKIIELNGGKSPNAVFLVGGGAHTPFLREVLAEKLNLPLQRTAVKGRDSVIECMCDNALDLGSIGVTVLGIALIAIKKSGSDFINVTLNGSIISLFNSRKHTVMDLVMQAGINPKLLIGKRGKSKRFIVNGIKRVAFGKLPKSSEIVINGEVSSMDSEVKDGDVVDIKYAENGGHAEPKVIDYVKKIDTVSFYLDDKLVNIEPVVFINGNKVNIDAKIEEGDNIEIIFPNTIGQYKKYFISDNEVDYCMNNLKLEDDYIIKEGDRIYKNVTKICDMPEKYKIEGKTEEHIACEVEKEVDSSKFIEIIINGKSTILTGKEKFVFIDIFDFVDFDLSKPKGKIVLKLNDKDAGYYDELHQGDKVDVYWQKAVF
ncbi:cell division protein FtsA [Clostridium tepidiprofundi DSM 19306]|uniref:Cell division protein FtsA n=1 Tax=Clostridium tepidiprofundi DSM 19306 TaxID=1121338 RepID=A0A151B5S4_9CLOT|nr:cell division protein FtsA [Clostridium tepidiprofundi]KYH35007.1 cell division protein FtsA [Clostridium tepidiprofundi DSM 19306]